MGGRGGLNFTRFADSRKGGGKGGGSREREWGILTVTYRQQAEQSRAEHYKEFIQTKTKKSHSAAVETEQALA